MNAPRVPGVVAGMFALAAALTLHLSSFPVVAPPAREAPPDGGTPKKKKRKDGDNREEELRPGVAFVVVSVP